MAAAVKGYKLVLVMPESMSLERRRLMLAYGATFDLTPREKGMKGAIARAQELLDSTPNAISPSQFENLANPAIHRVTTAEEIWNDTDGAVDIVVAGVGTGGTISGTGRYLKEVSAERPEADGGPVRIIGADPEGSIYSGGTGRPYLVEGVGEDMWPGAYDPSVPDDVIAVNDAEAFAMTRQLAEKEGLLVGGSSGMAVVAALRVAKDLPEDAVVVVLLPDSGRGYMSKIFDDAWMNSYGFITGEGERTVGDVLQAKSGDLPDLVHTHPQETIRDAIDIMREYGVSQLPVVAAEPPVMLGEVRGAVSERTLMDLLFAGDAQLSDAIADHLGEGLPLIGRGEPVSAAREALHDEGAVLVVDGGRPIGVLTRFDLLEALAN